MIPSENADDEDDDDEILPLEGRSACMLSRTFWLVSNSFILVSTGLDSHEKYFEPEEPSLWTGEIGLFSLAHSFIAFTEDVGELEDRRMSVAKAMPRSSVSVDCLCFSKLDGASFE